MRIIGGDINGNPLQSVRDGASRKVEGGDKEKKRMLSNQTKFRKGLEIMDKIYVVNYLINR